MAKQVIVMRKDLNMRKGKMVAQGSHASMAVILDAMTDNGDESWCLDMSNNKATRRVICRAADYIWRNRKDVQNS